MSVEDVTIEPMTEQFIVWRCLHGGPLNRDSIENLPPVREGPDAVDWEARRATNVPLLTKLVRTYGTCAMLAKDGKAVVGFVRFYPKALSSLNGAGLLCMQQATPMVRLPIWWTSPSLPWRQSRTRHWRCIAS